MSGAASTLSKAPKETIRKEIAVDGVEALKIGASSLGAAIYTPIARIRGEGFRGFSADEKKEWWKEEKKFKIGLIKTSGLDKLIDIYGETFDLSKRLSKEERKVFKGSCQYTDGLNVKEELDDANYAKAKIYGMNLKNDKGNPEVPTPVDTSAVMTTTDFEKLYLGWLYETPGLSNANAAAALPLPTAAVAEDKKKLKVEILKSLFRFIFGTANIKKVTKGFEKYRFAYTDFDVEEKIPCMDNPLWADFKISLEYRRDQAICELHSAKVVIGTEFNQDIEKKTALWLGLNDLINILEDSPCFQYDGTENKVEEESTFSDRDYQRALAVFNEFVSNKGGRNIEGFRKALAGLRKPDTGEDLEIYTKLYDTLVEALESLMNPADMEKFEALGKENEDLRGVVDLLTKRLTHSKIMTDLLVKASTLYTSKLCGKAERNEGLQKEYDDLLTEFENLQEESRQGAAELARVIVTMGAMRNTATGALEAQRMLAECVRVQDLLVQVITRVEAAAGTAAPADLDALNELLAAAKAEYGTMEEKRAALVALTGGLEGRDARIAVPGGPDRRLQEALDATIAAEAERDAAAEARAAANAARAAANADRAAAVAERDAARAAAALATAERDAARAEAAARGGDAAARAEADAARANLEEARTQAAAAADAARAAHDAVAAERNAARAAAAAATRDRNAARAAAADATRDRNAATAAAIAATRDRNMTIAAADVAVAAAQAEVTRVTEAATADRDAAAARVADATAAAAAAAAAAIDAANVAKAAAEAARNASGANAANARAAAAAAEAAAAASAEAAEAADTRAAAAATAADARAAADAAAIATAQAEADAANARAAAATGAEAAEKARADAALARLADETARADAAAAAANAAADNSAASKAAAAEADKKAKEAHTAARKAVERAMAAAAENAELLDAVSRAAAKVAKSEEDRAAAEADAAAARAALGDSGAAVADASAKAAAADARARAAEAAARTADEARAAAADNSAASRAAAAAAATRATEAEKRAVAAQVLAADKSRNSAADKVRADAAAADAAAARAAAAASDEAKKVANAEKATALAAAAAARAEAAAAKTQAALADAYTAAQDKRVKNIRNAAAAQADIDRREVAAADARMKAAEKAAADAAAAAAAANDAMGRAEDVSRKALHDKSVADEMARAANTAAIAAASARDAAERATAAEAANKAAETARADAEKARADDLAAQLAARTNSNARSREAAAAAAAAASAAERRAAAAEAEAQRIAAADAAARAEAQRVEAAAEAARVAEAARIAAERDAAARDAAARDAAARDAAERARPSSTQQIAEVKREAEVAKQALRDNKDEINAIINTFTGEKKIRIAKLLLNMSQIAIGSLTNLGSIKTPTFSAKYRYYIGDYTRMKKIDELKEVELTEAIEKELFKLQKPEGISELNKHFQALYWGEGKEGKGSVWTSNPETEVEFMISILDSMYKDFASLLLDNGSEPRDIIASLKLNSNIETSIDAAGLKKPEVIVPIRTLLGLILNRAFANAKIAKGERILESLSTQITGGGASAGGGETTSRAGGGTSRVSGGGGTSRAGATYIPPRSLSTGRPRGERKQVGGSRSIEFYKTMLILILLKIGPNSKEFLAKLKATMAATQEDLLMDLLRRIIDKWLKVKGTGYTISFTDLDKNELEGLEEAMKQNDIILDGDSLHAQAPEEFRDALGDQPYFLVGEGDTLGGLDEEVELEPEEKKALSGGISLTAVLAMYLLGLTHEILS